MSLVYYFDIGNTRLKFWCCRNGQIKERASIAHAGDAGAAIGLLPKAFARPPNAILGASVMGGQSVLEFTQACERQWHMSPSYAHSTMQHGGVINAYGNDSATLGVDRWLGLLAAREMSGDVCVVDCGTAVTLDVLRSDGQHLGGYILPGLAMMSGALLRETARVRFNAEGSVALALGRSTSEGVKNGAMAAIVSLIERVTAEQHARLVLTGGDAGSISPLLRIQHAVEPELLLYGLQRYFADAGIR